MTRIQITQADAFPERNQARNIICHLIAQECQLEIIAKDRTAFVTFYKGEYTARIKELNETVVVSDAPCVVDPKSVSDHFTQSRIDYHLEKKKDFSREVPALAIYDLLNIRAGIEVSETITILIHQPGRNGLIEDDKIKLYRKDW